MFQARWVRKAATGALWCLAVVVALVLINVVGIALAGNIERWQQWVNAHTNHFLAWRLILYANIAAGWAWMRRRVLARESGEDAHWRLSRAELACVVVVALIEATQAMKGEA
ncbi:MAG: hypothetical protein LBP99_02765 [Azoarcus sp.]|nr:hypothetical protein [Azoarcus sp.]